MRRGIARNVGFGLDDARDRPFAGMVAHDQRADQKPRECDRVDRQIGSAQAAWTAQSA
jgi:hypothetical protein